MIRHLAKVGVAIAMVVTAGFACANPTAPSVVSGSATFPSILPQTSSSTVMNWQAFAIKSDEATKFIQQNSSGAVLNQVLGTNPAMLNGTLLPRQLEAVRIPAIPTAGIPIFVRDGVYLETKIVGPSPDAATGVTRGENGVVRFVKSPAQVPSPTED